MFEWLKSNKDALSEIVKIIAIFMGGGHLD